MEKKDKMGMAISGLTVVSGLASFVGGPIGALVAMVLDTIKQILKIIDKRKKGPPESESSKLQKAIEKALVKFTVTGLNADWNGYKRSTEAYLKHLEMIDHFDEITPLEGKDQNKVDFGEMGGLEEVKQQLFDEVTPQIYKVLMSSTHLLGKIEYHITKVCDFDIQAKKVKSKYSLINVRFINKEPIPTTEEIDEKDSFASSCLKLYELYSKISSYHYQTYLKSLEAIDKIIKNVKTTGATSIPDDKQAKSKRKAYVFMHLLLDMIQSSREYNKKVFKPFLNPFDYYKMRYTVNYYYNNEKSYEHLTAYLKDFLNDPETLKTMPNKVMLCSQQSLLGSCYLEDGAEAQMPGPWRSSYIPKGKSITVQYTDKSKAIIASETPIKLIGPSSMGMLFTIKLRWKDDDDKVNRMQEFDKYVKKISIMDEPKEPKKDDKGNILPAKKMFKMCVSRDYNQDSAKHQGLVCITGEFKDTTKSIKLDQIKSPTMWEGKNISISSSEPDLAFVGSFIKAPLNVDKELPTKVRWGPFFSPFPMTELPASTQWDTITVYQYKNDEESKVQKLEGDINCRGGNNYLCQSEVIDKKLFITICKQAEMKGYCEEIPVLKSQVAGDKRKVVDLKMINGDGVYGNDKSLTDQAHATTEEIPGATNADGFITKKFDNYYVVDNSIWEPFIKDNHAYNLLQSMKVPDNLMVELYTEFGGKGKLFGPYQGPITVDQIDGNDVLSDLIRSIVIRSSTKEPATEELPPEGSEPELSVEAENPNMPNNAEPSSEGPAKDLPGEVISR